MTTDDLRSRSPTIDGYPTGMTPRPPPPVVTPRGPHPGPPWGPLPGTPPGTPPGDPSRGPLPETPPRPPSRGGPPDPPQTPCLLIKGFFSAQNGSGSAPFATFFVLTRSWNGYPHFSSLFVTLRKVTDPGGSRMTLLRSCRKPITRSMRCHRSGST